jgi:dTDP-4-amino-4,6-dideoxygalactose transaminase
MDGIQGAILRVKLRHLQHANDRRRSHAAYYHRAFVGIEDVVLPLEAPHRKHVYHVYALRVQDRDGTMAALTKAGIGCGIHYPIPIHLQEAYVSLGHSRGAFPVAERCADEFISLPMYPELTTPQLDTVIEAVKNSVGIAA